MSDALSGSSSQCNIVDGAVVLDYPLSPGSDARAASEQDALYAAMRKGFVELDGDALRRLRLSRFLSQQDLANDFWHRDFRVSIATIKRAECGHPVRFRIARELARYFDAPILQLVRRTT